MVINLDETSYKLIPDAEERRWCLTVALINKSPYGLSKDEIFSTLRGYREQFAVEGASQALDKKFEYDKQALKDAGIPLVTNEPENPADTRYFIDEKEMVALQFEPGEYPLLAAANAIWRNGAMETEARENRIKMLAADPEFDLGLLVNVPIVGQFDSQYSVIAEAIESEKPIHFSYLKPGTPKAEHRTVSPLALVQFDGRWHLNSFDHDRDEERSFLLSRIVGSVAILKTQSPQRTRDENSVARFTEHLRERWNEHTATVRVTPATKAAVVLKNRDGTSTDGDMYTIHYIDESVLAAELCEYGAEVVVLQPESLRAEMIDRFTRLANDHA